ncbi:MAG TPA: DUF4190 domain-containing protein [Polyangia bacterium]|nr:DUF4190 domain-containing protein [Polyangia bacterium]
MGIASMVLGIVSVIFGLVPFCGSWAVIPAVIGLTLGIVDLVVKSRNKAPRGTAIAGVILNPIAIIAVVLWTWLFVANVQPLPADAWQWQQSPAWQTAPGPLGQPLQPMQPMQPMQPVEPDPAMKSMQPVEPAPPAPSP